MQTPNEPGTERPAYSGDGNSSGGTEQIRQMASQATERTKDLAQEQLQRAKRSGKDQLESTKNAAASRTEELADAVDRAGDELHRQGQSTLAAYASDFAATLERFADSIRNRNIDELSAEAQALARRNPTLFVAGSVGVGFVLARFLKSSTHRTHAIGREVTDSAWSSSSSMGASNTQTSSAFSADASASGTNRAGGPEHAATQYGAQQRNPSDLPSGDLM